MQYINFFKWTLLLTVFTVFMACSNETETTKEEMVVEEMKLIYRPILGFWVDIGKPVDYKQAQEFIKHL